MKGRDLSGASLIFNLSCRSVFLRSVFLRSFVRSFVHTCARVFVAASCHQGWTEPEPGPVESSRVQWSPVESGGVRCISRWVYPRWWPLLPPAASAAHGSEYRSVPTPHASQPTCAILTCAMA